VDGQPQCSVAPTGYYPTGGSGYAQPTGTGVIPKASSSYAPVPATNAGPMPTFPAALLGAGLVAAFL